MIGQASSHHGGRAEALFFDVGQGSCNIIYLGGKRAIIIDCGKSARTPLSFIDRYVNTIEWLIVTHNDVDHDKGAVKILEAHSKKIQQVGFLQDRPVKDMRIFRALKAEYKSGNLLKKPTRLEISDGPVKQLFKDGQTGITLELLFPQFANNLEGQADGEPNSTSAVLAMTCGSKRIVYGGDLSFEGWQSIHDNLGKKKLPCEILAVPHHGGIIWKSGKKPKDIKKQLNWLYREAISSKVGIVSVGSDNVHKHPRPEVVSALTETGTKVMCTQITPQCHESLEELRPGVIRPISHSQSKAQADFTRTGRSRNVACAGTVLATVFSNRIVVGRLEEHQSRIDAVVERPICRVESSQVA